ncbi:hypothetical protein GCM10017083_18820 [Thalassobaculum fulvum]|uniref:histidine kinase n=2 Tax=Thalassobaculum fulvum TaxID=1633335 RepID=A0A918XQR0_9PROT|nr:hypothetical protein GCM10017083_18820 [Thalassobaculum fulvum]
MMSRASTTNAEQPARPAAAPAGTPGPQRSPLRNVVTPIAILGVAVVALILMLAVIAANSQNRLAIRSDQYLASSALRVETEQLGGVVRDYSFWNDAVENLAVEFDRGWAEDNVGAWANESLGMDATLVLDADLEPIFGSVDGAIQEADMAARFSPELARIVADARRTVGEPGIVPGVATSFLEFDGAPAIAGAAILKWEDDRPIPLRDGVPVALVFVRRIDEAMLRRFGELYLLSDMKLAPASAELADSIPLSTTDDRDIARLSWTGHRPGTALLRELALPLLGIAVLATALMVLIVRRARQSTDALTRSHDQLEAQTRALQASTEALQRALAEAARANAAKSDFLARMSHELRTPLNAILGFSEIISMEMYGPNSDPRYRDYGRMIHESGDHLRSLINDILDLAKIEAGRFELAEGPTSLGPIIEQCLGLLAPRIEAKGIRSSYRPTNVRLIADARAIKQILLNLMSNAVKFTGDGGEIAVAVSDEAEGIVLSVSDTGCGMTREELERVFQMFGQAKVNVSRDAEGSGLGLNIAKGLVEMHGGTLTVESEVGVGTAATVRLPSARRLPSEPIAVTG